MARTSIKKLLRMTEDQRSQVSESYCCICGRQLTDTESQQRGIGPVCARDKFEIEVEPNFVACLIDLCQPDFRKGLGEDLTLELYKMANRGMDNKKTKTLAKDMANLMFKKGCLNFEMNLITGISNMLRNLGFSVAAESMENILCDVQISYTETGMTLVKPGLSGKYVNEYRSLMKKAGAKSVYHPGKRGRFKHFEVAREDWGKVKAVLQYLFPNQSYVPLHPKTGLRIGICKLEPIEKKEFFKLVRPDLYEKYYAGSSQETLENKDLPIEVEEEPVVFLKTKENGIEIRQQKTNWRFVKDIQDIQPDLREAVWHPQQNSKAKREFDCWRVCISQKRHLYELLKKHFNGKRAMGPKGEFIIG